jgi:hypothetical protein
MVAELVELVTVVETSAFTQQAAKVWCDEERDAFIYYIAANPKPATSSPKPAVFAKSGGALLGAASAAGRG